MKICLNCFQFRICPCNSHGWCDIDEDFTDIKDCCDDYDGPSDEEDTTERDNPRDPIIERS